MKALLALLIGFGLAFTSLGGVTNETATSSGEHLLTRSYKLSADTFVRNLKQLVPPKPGESNQDLLTRFLKENDVKLHKPAAVVLDEKKGRLLVRATQADQDKIEILFQKIENPN